MILFLPTACSGHSDLPKEDLRMLNNAIAESPEYNRLTDMRLDSLKNLLRKRSANKTYSWETAIRLSKAYRLVNADSALRYAWEATTLADNLPYDPQRHIITTTTMINSLSTAGFFFAARADLDSLLSDMPKETDLKIEVWKAARILYSYTKAYSTGQPEIERQYDMLYTSCDDSLLVLLPDSSHFKTFLKGERLVVRGKCREAIKTMMPLLDKFPPESNLYGMAAFQIAQAYKMEGNTNLYVKYLCTSAISDIKGSIKDGLALPTLAIWLYDMGDSNVADDAFEYINFALRDATSGNTRMRAVNVSSSIPVIVNAYRARINRSRTILVISFTVAVILMAALAVLAYLMLRQIQRGRANEKKLAATSRMQEAYIGNFIGLCSNYAERLDSLTKLVGRKLSAGQSDDLLKLVNSGKFADDNEEFYKIFDHALLDLYPDFIEEINSLLLPEEHISVKEEGRLTAELRIYALVRLGVSESTRIAKILRYSVSTVYAYRNRMRNKAIDRDSFEKSIEDMSRNTLPLQP